MAEGAPFIHLDPATVAEARRRVDDPRNVEECTKCVMTYIYQSLPGPPVPIAAARTRAGADGVDRISAPLQHRLPPPRQGRGAHRHWCPIWRSTPLVLVDAHLLPPGRSFGVSVSAPTRADTLGLVATMSRILPAHTGPFRCVHLLCGFMSSYQAQLEDWLRFLAAKGVDDLILVNRPWPLEAPLPAAILRISNIAGIRSSPCALFTSVKILGWSMNFGVVHDAQMLPNFLKCFPNAESLHIVCARCTDATSLVSPSFWDDAGPIESIVSHVIMLTFREFKGEANAISFLKYFVQNVQMVKNVSVVLANPQFTSYSIGTLWRVKILTSVKWASKISSMQVYRSDDAEWGLIWSFQRGIMLSVTLLYTRNQRCLHCDPSKLSFSGSC